MSDPLARSEIEAAFRSACYRELSALKPGNVHKHAAGHGMVVAQFEQAADAAAPIVADPDLKVGQRIRRATDASFAATGVNTNLGIILLAVPLAKAAAEMDVSMGLRRRLAVILSMLDADDADQAFAAIRVANPAGLGTVETGDVHDSQPRLTLIQAMHLAADRDRIANAYVTAYADIFDFALPAYMDVRSKAATPDLAVSTLHMTLLAEFSDSHIARKYGPDAAAEVRERARALKPLWSPVATPKSFEKLMKFDRQLKEQRLNPGTTADFVVAALFASAMMDRKQS